MTDPICPSFKISFFKFHKLVTGIKYSKSYDSEELGGKLIKQKHRDTIPMLS